MPLPVGGPVPPGGTAVDVYNGVSMEPDFEAFVRASHRPLLRAAILLTSDHHHAQDLVQETYARVAQRWPVIVRQGGDPLAYSRTVLYRLAVDRWRARGRRPESPTPDLEPYAASVPRPTGPLSAGVAEDRVVLRQALARLTRRQRAVLVLRYWEDRTEVETAALLGCSVNTVKSQARHALRRLRELAPDLLADFAPQSRVQPPPAAMTEIGPLVAPLGTVAVI